MKNGHSHPFLIVISAISLLTVLAFMNWYYRQSLDAFRKELAAVRAEIVTVKMTAGAPGWPESGLDGTDRLSRALAQLGNKNVVTQYHAGQTIRESGAAAVQPLCELVRDGEPRAADAALIILASINDDAAVVAVRDMAVTMLRDPAGDERRTAGMLGVLARRRDASSLSLFREALDSESKAVRAAGVLGVRALQDMASMPLLMQRFGSEHPLVQAEIERCIVALVRDEPTAFAQEVEKLSPKLRFELVKLSLRHQGVARDRLLRQLSDDADPRVSAAAKRAFELLEQHGGQLNGTGDAPDRETEALIRHLNDAIMP